MSTAKRLRNPRPWCAAALILVLGAFAGNVLADPPDRVARISFLGGNVSFQPAGGDQWAQASLNRPLVTGDKVYTDQDSRVELEVGGATVRLDADSTFDLLNLDDNTAQIELTGGVMNLDVQRLAEGQSYEIDTPTLAFVVSQPGNYRIDIDPQGNSTMVSVLRGAGDAYGENNASYSVRAGSSYRFNDSALRDYEILDLPHPDAFDQWCSSRTARYQQSVSRNYVPEGTIGYTDLDQYGSWSTAPDYGNVWYPTTVATGWAPYRNGNWSWIDPWGWTWVDSSPWGFAPFHYGRWAYIGNRWGWCPGQRSSRAIYAPAMVAFVGGGGWGTSVSIGGGGPVGWFPLGPRDVYVPWYQASRGYFTNINVRNTRVINNTYITNVYNDYSRGRPITNANYAYRTNAAALTAVPRDAFIGSRSVAGARVQVNAANLRNAQVVSRIGIAPERASFVAANAARTRVAPSASVMDRRVIARTAPPARPVPIATRMQAIERNNAQPLPTSQLRALATPRSGGGGAATRTPTRIEVVGQNGAKPQPLPMRGNAAATRPAPASERANPAATRGGPGNTPRAPASATTPNANPARPQPGVDTRNALPSSRFAPNGRGAPSERGNALQPQNRTPSPATRAPVEAPAERSGNRQAPARNLPSERLAPRQNTAPSNAERPMQRTQPAAPPRSNPATQTERPYNAPQQREIRAAPQIREMPRSAPERQQPRAEPQGMQQRPMPQQRVQPQERPMQQQRVQRQERPMQQQRAQPQERPMQQQRAQPQERPPQQQRAQPQERPPQQQRNKKKDDNGDHR